MASTLDANGRMADFAARQALSMPLRRVKRRRVSDTLDTGSGPRLWSEFRPSLNTK